MAESDTYFLNFTGKYLEANDIYELEHRLERKKTIQELRRELIAQGMPESEVRGDEFIERKARDRMIPLYEPLPQNKREAQQILDSWGSDFFRRNQKLTTYRHKSQHANIVEAQRKGWRTWLNKKLAPLLGEQREAKFEVSKQFDRKGRLVPGYKKIDLTRIVSTERQKNLFEIEERKQTRLERESAAFKAKPKKIMRILNKAGLSGDERQIAAQRREIVRLAEIDPQKSKINSHDMMRLLRESQDLYVKKVLKDPMENKSREEIKKALEIEGVLPIEIINSFSGRELQKESLAQSLRERGISTRGLNIKDIEALARKNKVSLRYRDSNKYDMLARIRLGRTDLSTNDFLRIRQKSKPEIKKYLEDSFAIPMPKKPFLLDMNKVERSKDWKTSTRGYAGFNVILKDFDKPEQKAWRSAKRERMKEIKKVFPNLEQSEIDKRATQYTLNNMFRESAPIVQEVAMQNFMRGKYPRNPNKVPSMMDKIEFYTMPLSRSTPGPSYKKYSKAKYDVLDPITNQKRTISYNIPKEAWKAAQESYKKEVEGMDAPSEAGRFLAKTLPAKEISSDIARDLQLKGKERTVLNKFLKESYNKTSWDWGG